MKRQAKMVPIAMVIIGILLAIGAVPVSPAEEKGDRQVVRGPVEVTFGQMLLSLPDGAAALVTYQPQDSRLEVETSAGQVKITVSARNLLLVENIAGKVEVLLTSTGRVVIVEPGKSEVFGRAIVNDQGHLVVTAASKVTSTVLWQPLTSPVGDIPGANLGYRPRVEGFPVSPTQR